MFCEVPVGRPEVWHSQRFRYQKELPVSGVEGVGRPCLLHQLGVLSGQGTATVASCGRTNNEICVRIVRHRVAEIDVLGLARIRVRSYSPVEGDHVRAGLKVVPGMPSTSLVYFWLPSLPKS